MIRVVATNISLLRSPFIPLPFTSFTRCSGKSVEERDDDDDDDDEDGNDPSRFDSITLIFDLNGRDPLYHLNSGIGRPPNVEHSNTIVEPSSNDPICRWCINSASDNGLALELDPTLPNGESLSVRYSFNNRPLTRIFGELGFTIQ